MDKTLRVQNLDLLKELFDNIKGEKVSFNPYGTSNEDSFLSGINDGIDKALDVVQNFIYTLEEHE